MNPPASAISRKPLPPSPATASSVPNSMNPRPLPPTPPELPARPRPVNDYNFPAASQSRPPLSVLTPREGVSNSHNVAAGRFHELLSPPPTTNVMPNGRHSSPTIRNLEQLVHKSNENQRHLEDILNDLEIEATVGAQQIRRQSTLEMHPPPPKRPSLQTTNFLKNPDEGTFLTLIRRDPSSNEQWNVANISDPPVFDVSSDKHRTKKTGQPMYLTITNPSYAKFAKATPRASFDSSIASRTPSNSSDESTVTGESIFQRRLWMEGSTFSSTSSRHRKSISAESINPYAPISRFPGSSERPSSDSLRPEPTLHSISLSGSSRSKTKGYTFLSPWNGRCEFSASAVGGSLKCRHSFLSPYLSVDGRNEPIPVSELRFNLPGGGPLASSTPTSVSSTDTSSVRLKPHRSARDLFHRRSRAKSSTSIPNYAGEEDRLDLSLGQELAGGGFAGKRAKLGKLIVEGEGAKMLDLLVAANMAVWWRAWDKA